MAKFSCPVCKAPTNDESGCFRHKPKKAIKKTPIKIKPKSPEKIQEEKEKSEKMDAFWWDCWKHLPRFSEVSKWYKFKECNKTHYHHLFQKSKHPELKYALLNIICVSWEEHSNLDNDLEYYEEAKIKRQYILENWNEIINQSKLWEEQYENIKNNTYD